MEDNNKANIVFNISGGNNQILPNAIKAEQNFYGDKYIEEMMKAKTKSQEPVLSPETTRLSLYINNVEALAEYVAKLSACTNAKELAQVVMDMVNDTDVKVDQDIMVKQEFIEVLQPLAPQVTTGISNIRKYINEAWYKWKWSPMKNNVRIWWQKAHLAPPKFQNFQWIQIRFVESKICWNFVSCW